MPRKKIKPDLRKKLFPLEKKNSIYIIALF